MHCFIQWALLVTQQVSRCNARIAIYLRSDFHIDARIRCNCRTLLRAYLHALEVKIVKTNQGISKM